MSKEPLYPHMTKGTETKYVQKRNGSIISVESWEKEKAGMIRRGETVPFVTYIGKSSTTENQMMPNSPIEGPPLPRKFNIKWPWRK